MLVVARRSGEGPGEYRAISHVNAGPGYIHVFAHSQGRVLLDYDFNVVRMDRFPGQVNSSFVTESDDVIFSADVPTQRAVGHKFHILSPSGEMTSFGGEGSVYRGRSSTFYKLTGDGANTVWAVGFAQGSRYIVAYHETDEGVPYLHLLESRHRAVRATPQAPPTQRAAP